MCGSKSCQWCILAEFGDAPSLTPLTGFVHCFQSWQVLSLPLFRSLGQRPPPCPCVLHRSMCLGLQLAQVQSLRQLFYLPNGRTLSTAFSCLCVLLCLFWVSQFRLSTLWHTRFEDQEEIGLGLCLGKSFLFSTGAAFSASLLGFPGPETDSFSTGIPGHWTVTDRKNT